MDRAADIGDWKIEPATESDVGVVLRMIRELADYEGLAHEVVATESDLRRTLFGDRRYAEVLLGKLGGEPVAFALFFHNYSTFLGRPGIYLEDLYVQPEARGRGLGKALMLHVVRLARDRGCGRVEWWVLDDNRPAIGFYERLGARAMKDWTVYRLEPEAGPS